MILKCESQKATLAESTKKIWSCKLALFSEFKAAFIAQISKNVVLLWCLLIHCLLRSHTLQQTTGCSFVVIMVKLEKSSMQN